MKNKKGFTLIELLAVIAIIALISLIAIPNIIGLSTGIRKDQMLDDAKKLISMAKYKVSKSYEIRNLTKSGDGCTVGVSCVFKFSDLNTGGDIKGDPDGGEYKGNTSTVTYSLSGGVAKYCVYLEGSKRKICKKADSCTGDSCACNLCVNEDNLYSRNNVHDN